MARRPLLEFGPPSRLHSDYARPQPEGLRAPLLGFSAPSAHGVKRVHVSTAPEGASRAPRTRSHVNGLEPWDFTVGSHPAGYGVARGFSRPLSDFFLSSPSRRFQTGGAPGVLPFRGSCLPRSPADSSSAACPLDLPPAVCAELLSQPPPWAHRPSPRMTAQRLYRSSGPSSAWKSIRINDTAKHR